MSVSTPPPLPSIINNLKPSEVVDVLDVKQDGAIVSCPIVILHTKDISAEDIALLSQHGTVKKYNYSMFNVDISTLSCDYLLVDVRDKLIKFHISKLDTIKYKFCAYVHSFQKHDNIFENFISDINIITKFPSSYDIAFKEEFDGLLTEFKKIKSTSCITSLLSFLVNGLSSVLKK